MRRPWFVVFGGDVARGGGVSVGHQADGQSMSHGRQNVRIHPHAAERMTERGATEAEVIATVCDGERFPAKFGRTGFRRSA